MSKPQRRRPNRVREYRESLYLTPEELAERAGVSSRTLWSVETGYPCRLVTRRAILKALGVARRDAARIFPPEIRPHAPLRPGPGPERPQP